MTSNKGLNVSVNFVHPLVKYCYHIKHSCAVELFLETLRKNGRIIQPREVTDLIKKQDDYPIRKIYPKLRTDRLFPDQHTIFEKDMMVIL